MEVDNDGKPSWSNVPLTVQKQIINYLDVQTSVKLRGCAFDEMIVVNRFANFHVKICVKHEESQNIGGYRWIIELKDKESKVIFEWMFVKFRNLISKVTRTDLMYKNSKSKFVKGKSLLATMCEVLQQLLHEKMFRSKELEFHFGNFDGTLDFGTNSLYFERLCLGKFSSSKPVIEILQNPNLQFKAVLGSNMSAWIDVYRVRKFSYEELVKKYGHINSNINKYIRSFGFNFWTIKSYEAASETVVRCFSSMDMFKEVIGKSHIQKKLNSKKTINYLMYFRSAYYSYTKEVCPYLEKEDPYFKTMIAFLKDGMEKFLLDEFQLFQLSIVYLVRLFRRETEMRNILVPMYTCLWEMLKQYQDEKYYEKIHSKLELMFLNGDDDDDY